MAIGPVVTRGYGTFGTANLVITRGYTPSLVPTNVGPYRVEIKSIYVAGAAKSHVYLPGASESEVYLPGAAKAQVE